MTPSAFTRWLRWAPAALLALCAAQAHSAVTDIATSPLQTSTATLVKPNIFFILDDSGSMYWDFMPDWAEDYKSTTALVRNSRFNGVFYDPAVTYTPPVKYDGSSYNSMTSANTSAWTKVPFDGFGVMTASGAPNTGTSNLFTSSNSGTTQDLTGGTAYYYTFIAGEYCTSANLRTCNTQSAATATYPYPGYLRWCSSSALTSCQAARIDTDPGTGVTYTYPRYPGVTSSVAGSNTKVTISAATGSYPYPGTSAKASTRTDCAGTTCTYTEEMTNFANWWAYYRTRMQMAKSASSIAMAALSTSYRLGYMSINNNTGSDFLNVLDITTTSSGQKSAWYSKLVAAKPTSGTSLRSALATAGQYFAGKLSKVNNQSAIDPMQYACQRNYTILTTDGYWNASSATPTQVNASTAIGDQDSSESRPQLDGTATANTLADVAEYYYATDLRTAALGNATSGATGADVASNSYSNGQQRMYTYTVGMGASGYMQYLSNYASATSGDYYDVLKGTTTSSSTLSAGTCSWQKSGSCNWPVPKGDTQTTIDDLWHTAVNGRGTFYSATNPSELKTGLTSFINSVNAATSSAAAPTLSTANLSTTGSNYAFGVTFCAAKWFGDLARYSVNATTGAVSTTPDWSESGSGKDCTDSSATLATTPLLDKIAYDSRVIYTYDSSAGALIPFKWASLNSTMQGYFKVAAMTSLSQMCSSGSTCLPTASQIDSTTAGSNTGAGGINLVNYLRGDRSNEGTANTAYYFPRTHVLGDIVSGQPVYVQAPLYGYADSGYAAFKSSNAGRQGMVYVNANDGMVHAFNADTGAEVWAYLPSLVLPSLYKLADKNYASNHVFLNDGTLSQADVYYGGAWHTILVGGLGAGGRGFYALDVTTPASPKILWEFTYDTSKSSPYISDADLGYAFGTPVVTKLSDGTWTVVLTSGYNNVSPGSGHGILYVLNAQTGAIIKKIDNGVGTTTGGGTVSGCSAAPCPSGLAKISGWLESGTNNTSPYIYGGDLYGNLWRFNIASLTAGGGSATAQSLATLMDSTGTRQPVTTRPELGLVSNQRVIYVGTGAYLGVSDISSTGTQSLYAIKDTLATSSSSLYGSPRANTCSASSTTGCFVKQILSTSGNARIATSSVGYAVSMSTMYGWYEDLPLSGERINVDPTLQEGVLIYVSNVPSTTGACSVGGSSYLNYVSYSTGLAVSSTTTVGEVLSADGLATSLTLYKTASGNTVGIGKLSTGGTVGADPPDSPASTATRRVFWRELIKDK
ncbi:MAG TPA: PQQ-binding-like beta-propeller repeat protein [Candidatus Aquabacterium excrementipullorum]|nr:PQQ-binding-like beta-propeller repeat protein [Candidatus Aquabacterium excrementipullorum]